MALVAVLSCRALLRNPATLPALRGWCAQDARVFHYEIDAVDGVGEALRTLARIRPRVLVLNGGDALVRTALTEMADCAPFGANVPPIAVLPDARGADIIAMNLNGGGSAIDVLRAVTRLAGGELGGHVVSHDLIALRKGTPAARPVMGMFLGGADLADTILWCRRRLYPLGLPDRIAHMLALAALFIGSALNVTGRFLPSRGSPLRVTWLRGGRERAPGGKRAACTLLFATTLDRMLFGARAIGGRGLRLMAVERGPGGILRMIGQALRGRIGRSEADGVELASGDVVRIDGEDAHVLLDGELFVANADSPIYLSAAPPVAFLKVAA